MASLRARVLTGHLAQVALILLGFSSALYLVVRWRLTAELDASLLENLRSIEGRLRLDDGDELEFQYDAGEYPPDLYWSLSLASGKRLWSSESFPGFAPSPPAAGGDGGDVRWNLAGPNGEPMRAASRRIEVSGRPRRFEAEWRAERGSPTLKEKKPKPADLAYEVEIVVARGTRQRDEALLALLAILAVTVPITLALSVLGGLRLVRRALAPVTALARGAETIGPENLSERVPAPLERDEIGRLAHVINGMLERLEAGFHRERRFTSDASHELRSPLTALRGEIEVALRRQRTPEEHAAILQRLLGDVERLERLVTGLLILARSDADRLPVARELADLEEVSAGAIASVERSGEAPRVEVIAAGPRPLLVEGDAGLLETLLRNLVENAVLHGAPPVRVELGARNGCARIRVCDAGPGIPPEALAYVFDRFFRADPGRDRRTGGTGLGLAIARSIAAAHGGKLEVESPPAGGAIFTVELPLARGGAEGRSEEGGGS